MRLSCSLSYKIGKYFLFLKNLEKSHYYNKIFVYSFPKFMVPLSNGAKARYS